MGHLHSHSFSKQKNSVALSSVFASFFLTALKIIVGVLTGSLGIISEAAHSALDFVAALMTYIAVKLGDKPADEKHPYGHGKVESVSAFLEVILLFITAIWVIYEAIHRLLYKSVEVKATWYAMVVVVISIIIDISRSRALKKTAKKTRSQALEADALHFSSDIWSSAAVLLGLICVRFGFGEADAIAALGVAIFVIAAGYKLGRRTLEVLVDTAPAGLSERVEKIAEKIEGVVSVKKIMIKPAGAVAFADIEVNVSRKLSQEKAQQIAEEVEDVVEKEFHEVDATAKAYPLSLSSESIIERIRLTALNQNLEVHDVAVQSLKKKKFVSFDLEVAADLTIGEAHRLASSLEEKVKADLGGEVEINTHIEPAQANIVLGEELPVAKQKNLRGEIEDVIKKMPAVSQVHGIKIRQTAEGVFVSLHCNFKAETPLLIVHEAAARLEFLIREIRPEIKRVVVHTEVLEEHV